MLASTEQKQDKGIVVTVLINAFNMINPSKSIINNPIDYLILGLKTQTPKPL